MVMQRLIWLVLNDGRSVVAGCGSATREVVADAIAEPEKVLMLASDDGVERIPASAVRDFVLFEARAPIPPEAGIPRLVHD